MYVLGVGICGVYIWLLEGTWGVVRRVYVGPGHPPGVPCGGTGP